MVAAVFCHDPELRAAGGLRDHAPGDLSATETAAGERGMSDEQLWAADRALEAILTIGDSWMLEGHPDSRVHLERIRAYARQFTSTVHGLEVG